MTPIDDAEDDFPDLSAVTQYMTRRGVGRLNLTIEAVGLKEEDLGETTSRLILLKDFSFDEGDIQPDPHGLDGIFMVVWDEPTGGTSGQRKPRADS
jgi:hypothetical protein